MTYRARCAGRSGKSKLTRRQWRHAEAVMLMFLRHAWESRGIRELRPCDYVFRDNAEAIQAEINQLITDKHGRIQAASGGVSSGST